MSEIFTVVCTSIAVSAGQDILTVYTATTKKAQVLAVELFANAQATINNVPIRIRYLPATVTAGSGGAVVTPSNVNAAGAAASFTARRNDTTHATTSGTALDWVSTMFNPINGYYWTPPVQPGDEPKADLSTAIVLSLDAAPVGAINVSATMWIKEL